MPAPPLPEADALAALGRALGVVGDRWSLAIVAALLDGPLRYGELQARLGTVAPNVLARRLRRLEEEGLLDARPYSTRPPRHEYGLTDAGRDLSAATRVLTDWGAQHGGEPAREPLHTACGTPLETRWYCPACDEVLEGSGLREPPEDVVLA